jgi:hypothetical protein
MQPRTLINKIGKDNEYKIVKRYLESLKHYGFTMYPTYTPDETALYRPVVI